MEKCVWKNVCGKMCFGKKSVLEKCVIEKSVLQKEVFFFREVFSDNSVFYKIFFVSDVSDVKKYEKYWAILCEYIHMFFIYL